MKTRAWVLAAAAAVASCGQSTGGRESPPVVAGPMASSQTVASPASAASVASHDCGVDPANAPYIEQPAWTGRKAVLPVPPSLPDVPHKTGDSYTVFGAVHLLHARYSNGDLAKKISIVGVIVDTNLGRADKCALHRVGVADAPGCTTPIPAFTIADPSSGSGPGLDSKIRVMGWASNFANVFEASLAYKNLKERPRALYRDAMWDTDVPFPLPAVGAKVRVSGRYAITFTRSSSGISADPQNGIFTVETVEYLEPARVPAKVGP